MSFPPPRDFQPPGWTPAPVPRMDARATGALIVSIGGLCGPTALFCFSPLLGGLGQLLLGVLAVAMGIRARQAINASGGRLTGEGMAMAGIIIGAVSVAAGFLAAVIGFNYTFGD